MMACLRCWFSSLSRAIGGGGGAVLPFNDRPAFRCVNNPKYGTFDRVDKVLMLVGLGKKFYSLSIFLQSSGVEFIPHWPRSCRT
jgi:hypothetical protein